MNPATPAEQDAPRADATGGPPGPWRRFRARLGERVDAAGLAAFRIVFGVAMAFDIGWLDLAGGRVYALGARTVVFPFPAFEWLPRLPLAALYAWYAAALVAAILVGLGLFYRPAAIAFFVLYLYPFLLDSAEYNNHYYLIALVAFLFCFVDANRCFSLDARRRGLGGAPATVVPAWQPFLLRAQITIVYFFGGVAKLDRDWLAAEPLKHWLRDRGIGFLANDAAAYFLSYTGIVFDLAIGFLLWSRRTRRLAIPVCMAFHISNNFLFTIGIFPWLMMGAIVIYLDPATPRAWAQRLFGDARAKAKEKRKAAEAASAAAEAAWPVRAQAWAPAFVTVYLAIQILVPLRHWLYPGVVAWNEEGHAFSWRMKLRAKAGQVTYLVTDKKSHATKRVPAGGELTARQLRYLSGRPALIEQYARRLRDKFAALGFDVEVRAETLCSLNYREPQALVDPRVDLATAGYPWFATAPWITELVDTPPGAGASFVRRVPQGD